MVITEADLQAARRGRPRRRWVVSCGILAVDIPVLVLVPLPGVVQVVLGGAALAALFLIIRDGFARATPFRD